MRISREVLGSVGAPHGLHREDRVLEPFVTGQRLVKFADGLHILRGDAVRTGVAGLDEVRHRARAGHCEVVEVAAVGLSDESCRIPRRVDTTQQGEMDDIAAELAARQSRGTYTAPLLVEPAVADTFATYRTMDELGDDIRTWRSRLVLRVVAASTAVPETTAVAAVILFVLAVAAALARGRRIRIRTLQPLSAVAASHVHA